VGDVAAAIASRLVAVGRVAAAVDVLEGVGDVQGAVEAAVSGQLFDRARALAAGNPNLTRLAEEAHTRALVASSDADELAARGNAAAAVEILVNQGNWERAHTLVSDCALTDGSSG